MIVIISRGVISSNAIVSALRISVDIFSKSTFSLYITSLSFNPEYQFLIYKFSLGKPYMIHNSSEYNLKQQSS